MRACEHEAGPVSSGREVIYETRIIGEYAQVRAIDVATGLEVAVTTPAGAAEFDQRRLALRKLEKALADAAGSDPKRRGLIV
jgi:hypothetical protein